jgi:hypothetical protein
MGKINTFGLIAGTIAWILIMWYASTQSACLKTNSCDGEDMVLFAIIGIGMLAPSWIVASIASMFGSE